ncbi:PAS domain-containing protein, partial [Ferruginibacter sp.]
TVLNHELIGLNEQITDARNYNESIVATLYQPLLVLDKHLRVKTANKAFYKTFKVNEQETEGVLIYDLGNRQWNIPELRTLLEEVLPQKKQITDYEVTHNFSSIGIRTILLCALEITREKKEEKLILLSIEDVTEKASAQKKIKESEHRFHELVRSSPSLISICKGEDMIIEIANDAILESWGKGNIIGQSVFDAIPESVEQGFDKLLLSVYKTGVPVQANEVPVTLLRKGIKELVYYNLIYQPQRNVDDEIEGVAIISTEVTPQAEFNLKIKASEEQLRSLVMQAPVAICIFKGRDFIVEVANKGFLQIVGKAENEYVGKPVFDSVPETRSTAEPLLLQVLNTGVPYFGNELENTITRFGKTEKGFFNFVFQPILGNDGTATGIMVVANEVTEQVHARKKVEESEAKYRSLFDTMDQGFCIVEVLFDEHNNPIDYLFVEVNPVFEEQSGLKNAAGKTILELVPDLEKRWFNIYGKVVTTGESIRFIEGSDAMGRMFDVYAFKVGEVESRRIAILFTDITEQKRTEKNLIESEERFRSLVMATSNTVYKMSADWKVMYNLEGKDFLADTTDSSISWLQKYIPESERTLVIKTIEEAIAHKKIFELEHQVFDADGNIAWTYSRAVPKINEKGEIIEWTGAASNITERKRAEQTLVESEQRFRSLVEKSPNPICIFKGTQMTLELANEPMLKIFSAGEEALGKPYLEILPEMKEQPFMALLLDVLQNGVTHYGTEQPAYFVRQNGEKETYYFNFVYQPYHENDGSVSGVMVLATDVTEQVLARKKVELQNQLFSDMLMTAPGFVATLAGPDHVYELVNEKYQSLFGKREIKGKAIMEALPELEGQGFDTLLDNVYNTGEPYVGINIPITLARDEGLAPEERYFNFSYQPMYDEYKNIFSILVFGYEVTAQVIATKKIEESESFNRAVLESSPDCIKMLDADGRLQFMNSNGICLLELDDFEQVQNTYWWDMWEPDNRQIIKDAVETAKSGEKIQLQLFGPTAKGTPKWWDIIVLPVQEDGTDKNLHRILSVSRDITKQKLNELKEKELLTRFQNLVLQAPVAICVLRGQNYVIEVINKGMYEMWDRTLEQALNKPAFEVLPELMEQGFKELLDNVYKTGERFVADELPINLKRNGKIENAFVKFVYEPLKDADGTISGVMALAHEITGEVLSRKKIEESEIKFRSLIEEAPVATCMFTGREMKIEVANDIMIGYWGKGKSVIGKPLAVAVPELKGQPFLKILDEVFTTGKTYHSNNARAELELDGLLGTYYFDFTYKPIFNAVGEVYGIMDMAVDVTEQVIASKKIEESEAHFRQLADLMPAKISNANVDGEVTYFNKSWLDFSGFNFEELRDFGYHQIIHPDELEEFQTRFQNATVTLTDLVMEMRFKNKAGDYVWHLNIASPVKDENGKHKMWIGVTTDISEQIKIREGNLVIYETYAKELREAKELAELATVIAEAAKDNAEKAAAIAEEAVKSKQQFLSNMSHEIRTPMNAIIGFSKVVLKTDLTEKQKEYLTAIKISGDALIVLINDILDLAKVDSGKMTFEQIPFKLADSIKVMMHLFEPKVQEKNIELVKEYDNKIPAVLVGDPVRLHQIILNLLSNAVKFTNQGKITVNVSLLNEDEEKVTVAFAVSDTGIGIPQDKIASIFENFQQASADTTRLYGGTGLGLAISKQLVTMQGGNITVKSKVGEGAVFSFTLSFKKTTARVEAAAEIIKIAAQIKNIKVLVVEDVALNQLLVKTLLEDFGFDCDICANGKLAIEKLHTGAYDIILMDLQMPEMNGFEATEYIRHTMHSAIPIIALTADVTTADVAKCKAVGMDDYISKPVDEKLLYSKIIKLMEKPGTVEEIIAAIKYTNLEYLQKHTKSNPKLMMEMIQLYLEQTPPLINTIKQSLAGKNWELLQSAVHKMIPSFSIVGMNPDFTAMAKKIQQYSIAPEVNDEVHDLVLQLEKACGQACIEMEEAYNSIKNTNS